MARQSRNQSSADFQSTVSRVLNPLLAQLPLVLPTGQSRYSRLETCATKRFAERKKISNRAENPDNPGHLCASPRPPRLCVERNLVHGFQRCVFSKQLRHPQKFPPADSDSQAAILGECDLSFSNTARCCVSQNSSSRPFCFTIHNAPGNQAARGVARSVRGSCGNGRARRRSHRQQFAALFR